MTTKICPICSSKYDGRGNQIFCTDICRKKMWDMRLFYDNFRKYYFRYGKNFIIRRNLDRNIQELLGSIEKEDSPLSTLRGISDREKGALTPSPKPKGEEK